jgi:hypothetical protein
LNFFFQIYFLFTKGQAKIEIQATATPKNLSDPEFIEWEKNENNPLILPPPQVSNNSFRGKKKKKLKKK